MKRRLTFLACVLAFVLVPTLVESQQKGWMRVEFTAENRFSAIPRMIRDDVAFISIQDLADLLNIKSAAVPRNKKLLMYIGSRELKLTASNPFIIVDQDVYQLPLPPEEIDGRMYVPLLLFMKTVGSVFPGEFQYDAEAERLSIIRTAVNITGIEVEEKLNGSMIRFITTRDFKQSDIAVSIKNNWLYVTLNQGKLDSARVASREKMGIIRQIVPFPFENSVQVSFQLTQAVSDPQVLVNPGEVTISLRSPGSFDTSLLDESQERMKWMIDTIILDPGHGGPRAPGAIGLKWKTKEKEITLDIALRLKSLLAAKNIQVHMTRETDKDVPLAERTKFANSKGGKLFLSIHVNGNPSRKVRGYSAFFLGKGKEEQALAIAQDENSVIELEESQDAYKQFKDASFILNAIAQSAYQRESQDLARMLNKQMKRLTSLPQMSQGVYQAGFYVLVGAAMPAVLVETAHITNEQDEKYLGIRANRQKIAQALFEAIMEFREKYEKGISDDR